MSIPIPRALSGSGHAILTKIHRPLLQASENFDRVSSFFGPKGLAISITEISAMWKGGGKVRLILSPVDSSDIHLALENLSNDTERIVSTVQESIELAMRKINGTHPEVVKALEEMLVNNLLQVTIVVPREGLGLFHSKFSIYHIDSESNIGKSIESGISKYVAVHGSFNETGSGYGKNIEDASTHCSWVPSEYEVARVFKLRFDELWNDFASDSVSIPITDVLKRALDIHGGTPGKNKQLNNLTVGEYLNHISTIPYSLGYNESIWLMPHQISVVNSAMTYVPVRAMLCDEVGLGKTIQAGAILSRLMAEKTCQRVLIIAPAAIMMQWAIEISSKFGHPVSLYRDQCRKRYLNGQLYDETRGIRYDRDSGELIDNCPVVIISSQWFRLRSREYVETLSSNFQLLILDEAHHARLHNWDKREGTKLREKINIASEIIPNVLLLTATPFQTGENDYLSLLDILQNVEETDLEDIRIGIGVVSGDLPWNPNQQANLVRSIARRFDLLEQHLEPKLVLALVEAKKPLRLNSISKIINDHVIDEKLLFSTLPTTLFTYRHTRSMLREIGMGFPEVIFNTVSVEPNEYDKVLKKSENFIIRYLGGNEYASGLTRSLFYQRAISSINALYTSLMNRRDNVLVDEIMNADYDLDFERMRPASAIEIERIEILLKLIEETRTIAPDPKIGALKKLLNELMHDDRRTLIFSRYTATTDSIESELWTYFPNRTIGRYDGDHIRIRLAGDSVVEDVTKDVLIKRLMKAEIDVIVCSDAASEGLNLHSASAVINVDVPWNPARVLQRIGRVDRLGQMSDTVVIHNLVYFDTIEERMYRVLDDRQTEAIRYLGEFPELMSTEESRHMYQVFGVPIRERVDSDQAETREDVVMQRLLKEHEHHESNLNVWMESLIAAHPEIDVSTNPTAIDFAMRNSVILEIETGLTSAIGGEFGYAVSDGVKHALLLNLEGGFIPVTPSLLMKIFEDNGSEGEQILYEDMLQDIGSAVDSYVAEFSSVQMIQRSPGLMADKFPFAHSIPDFSFESI